MSVPGEQNVGVDVLVFRLDGALVDVVEHDKIRKILFKNGRGILRFDNGVGNLPDVEDFSPQRGIGKIPEKGDVHNVVPVRQFIPKALDVRADMVQFV